MTPRWLNYSSNIETKNKFIRDYLDIFNAPENLKFLSFFGEPFTKDQVYTWVYGLAANSDIKYVYVEIKDQIVGIVVLKTMPPKIVEIYGLGVHPKYKRIGIAKIILNEVISKYMHSSVIVKVFEDNIPMLSLLKKFGFKFINYEPETRIDGVRLLLYKLG